MKTILLTPAVLIIMAVPAIAEKTSNLHFEFSHFTKKTGTDTNIFRDGAPGGTPITHLTSDNAGKASGVGFVVEYKADKLQFPVSFRAIISPNQSASLSDPNYIVSNGGVTVDSADAFGNGLFGPITGLDLSAKFDSSFTSAEVNTQFAKYRGVAFSAGLKALRFTDSLELDLEATPSGFAGTGNLINQRAANDMVVPQIGFQMKIPSKNENFKLEAFGNLGVLRNSVDYSFGSAGYGLAAFSTPGGAVSERKSSKVAEVGLKIKYDLGKGSVLKLGTNLIYIDRAATSVASLATTEFQTATASIGYESVLFHAVTIGFEHKF